MKRFLITMVRPVAMILVSFQLALTLTVLALGELTTNEIYRTALLIVSIITSISFVTYLITNKIMMIRYQREARRQIELFMKEQNRNRIDKNEQ